MPGGARSQHRQRHVALGCGERAVDRVEVLDRQFPPGAACILAHAIGMRRLWDRERVFVPSYPVERHLPRGALMTGSDRTQDTSAWRGRTRKRALSERRVGHHRNALALAV